MKAKKPTDRPFFSNNDRRRAGLPARRKASQGKRYKTRCEAEETIAALLDFFDGENSHPYHR